MSKTGEAARGEAPPMRSCICSNCRRVMPTSGFCQRRRGCKSKNAGRNLHAAAFDEQNQRPVNVPGRDPNHCRDCCRNCWILILVRTILTTMMKPVRMTAGYVAGARRARRPARCGGRPRAHCVVPGWELVCRQGCRNCMCWAAAVVARPSVPIPGESKSDCRGSAPAQPVLAMNNYWPVTTDVAPGWTDRVVGSCGCQLCRV